MNDREYALAKELAALWPECLDTRQQSGVWVASGHLQDYLEAAEKKWPGEKLTLDGRYRAYLTPSLGRTYEGKGATPCERILAALLQAAKGEGA